MREQETLRRSEARYRDFFDNAKEAGSGTVFKVYLPRVESPSDIEKQKATPASALEGKETILLVEDEEIVRRMARIILENQG